ncbi:MAG: aldose epimerase family protein [uncultured Sphingosinicella sp.]|uniref:Aldose epimerase family protein n=1 Tax=uncultured Sphingosinicella sp. TaxID=478748 RepID=A0A6J4U0Z4_9SPHN|nr:aldose 1-epimerase [uncultured Sphingosinicella sp.]CAA9535437.1 MAG: aldose epimerase family protein [uncultured Sphingosinicella sp.]
MIEKNEDQFVELRSGTLRAELAPRLGGSVARLNYVAEGGSIPVLRGPEGVPRTVLETGSFPLVPYSNRIRSGRFFFRGRDVIIAPNMAGDPSPLHGQGWLAPWEILSASESSAELAFRHDAGEWPWSYEARQLFELSDTALDIRLSCRNVSDDPMPCGLGQHPYFHCTPETRLDTEVEGAWTIDENVLPVERVPATGRYDLRNRLVYGQDIDHGFDGWRGRAVMRTPGLPFAIEMSSPDATCFQLYSPPQGGIYVAEPVSHTNAALNAPEAEWGRLGLRVLKPGEEMVLHARIAVLPA